MKVTEYGHPELMNTDQGCQFTSDAWGNYLKGENIRQSMDGRGRWIDNVSLEYEKQVYSQYMFPTKRRHFMSRVKREPVRMILIHQINLEFLS